MAASFTVRPDAVYATGVIQPGIVPAIRRAGLAGFDPTRFAVDQLPGMQVPQVSGSPSIAVRVLVTRGDNWRGRY